MPDRQTLETLDDLGRDLRSGTYQYEMLLVISADNDSAFCNSGLSSSGNQRVKADLFRPKYRRDTVLHTVPGVLSLEHSSNDVLGREARRTCHMSHSENVCCIVSAMSEQNKQVELVTLPGSLGSARKTNFLSRTRCPTKMSNVTEPE
ncbi:hypothetical protein J6590_100266 [Homalodisca vitripennis]|nr:hypothetical protein J6590_081985 [Homalodisca vitripennis]KAG8324101.1 hypothetical protein J6590_100266 [Homalodisca vitripennis]